MSGYVFHCTPCGFPHAGECPPRAKAAEPEPVAFERVIAVGSRWRFEHNNPGSQLWSRAGFSDGYEVIAIVANGGGGIAVQVREWNAPQYPVYTCHIGWWDPDGSGASDGGRNRFVPWT